jgi:transposase
MSERELERRAQRRLAVPLHVEEVGGNVAATCRYYGISRQCYYGWLRRYQADGLDGLKDRSSRPHHSPRLIQAEVIEKIVWLRKHYHFGPAKIARYLARYHDLTISSRTSHRWVDLAGWARACGVSGYDLTCRLMYDLTCRSRQGDHVMGSPPATRVRRSLRR